MNGDGIQQMFLKFHYNWLIQFAENFLSKLYKFLPTLGE